jgi:hypothetical protein
MEKGMRNARHVIAVTLMATAICADRALPTRAEEAPTSHLAGRLIERLSQNLRRVVPAAQLYQAHRPGLRPMEILMPGGGDLAADITPLRLSPFQFRLPPPLV